MKSKRSLAREHALQALYQWQVAGQDVADIERQFLDNEALAKADVGLFVELLREVPARVEELDETVGPYLDRPMRQVDPVERAVLRIGTFELMFHLEVPYKVVINEAVELAKTFGAEKGHRYINGVLDKLAQQLRGVETGASTS